MILLHSAFGLTDGVRKFGDLMRARGCLVEAPDYYLGRTFPTSEEGITHRNEVSYRTLLTRGRRARVQRRGRGRLGEQMPVWSVRISDVIRRCEGGQRDYPVDQAQPA